MPPFTPSTPLGIIHRVVWVERKWKQARPRDPGDLPPDSSKSSSTSGRISEYEAGAPHIAFRRGFYEQRLKIAALGPQTCAQANTVIEALKHRVQRALKAHAAQ